MINELGIDRSGNNNTWTVTNMTLAADQMVDSPTNNFATNLGFISKFHTSYPTITHSEGNLKVEFGTAGGGMNGAVSSMAIPSTGKWYMERCILTTGDGYGYPGDGISDLLGDAFPHATKTSYAHGGTINSDGDIYGVGYDADAGTVYWYKNGSQVSTSSIAAGLSGETLFFNVSDDQGSGSKKMPFITNYGQDSSFAGKKTAQGNQDANGIGDFYYTVPTLDGTQALALCTSNLPDVAVVPSEHFNTVLYTGDGNTTHAITGVGFQPDFLWVKSRSSGEVHSLQDIIRTPDAVLQSQTTEAQNATRAYINSFDSDGFTTGNAAGASKNPSNGTGLTYVAWNWKAANGTATNTAGNEDTTVSVNSDAGFSIVKWTNDGDEVGTRGHGLSKAPEMIITKLISGYSGGWGVHHKDVAVTNQLRLDNSNAAGVSSFMNDTAPTSTVFSVGTPPQFADDSYDNPVIAYCFHSVDGYSKVGTYTGNGDADGTFVYTGFRPAFILTKVADSSSYWWEMVDNKRVELNPRNKTLYANVSDSEYTDSGYNKDLVSNGFKIRGTNGGQNSSGNIYIYIAFAETPFKYSNAG